MIGGNRVIGRKRVIGMGRLTVTGGSSPHRKWWESAGKFPGEQSVLSNGPHNCPL